MTKSVYIKKDFDNLFSELFRFRDSDMDDKEYICVDTLVAITHRFGLVAIKNPLISTKKYIVQFYCKNPLVFEMFIKSLHLERRMIFQVGNGSLPNGEIDCYVCVSPDNLISMCNEFLKK